MVKQYYKRTNTLNVIVIVDGRAFRPIFEDNGHGMFFRTDNERIQYAIETSQYFDSSIFCYGCKPFTADELEKLRNPKNEGKNNTADNVVGDTPDMGGDQEAAKGDMEKISGVNTIQKVYAFFDARGISYAKPLTVAKAKELAAQNNIVFVDYK